MTPSPPAATLPRRRARRRAVAPAARRRVARALRRVPLAAWLALAATAVVLGGGWLWLRDSSLVAVRDVDVAGAQGPQANAMRAALQEAALDMTTLHVRTGRLRAAVAAYPLVRDVRVDAHPPHRLTITVIAERPVATITAAGREVAVTAAGKLLGGGAETAGLPVIAVATPPGARVSGARARGAVAAAAAAPAALRARIARLAWSGEHGLTATLRDGPPLYLGDADRLHAKWLAAARVLADPASRGAEYLDLTVPERPAAGGVAPLTTTTPQTLNQ